MEKEEVMEMESSKSGNWKHSLVYLAFITLIIHLLLHKHKLSGNDIVRVKRNPDLPLRFRYDGTFKILQVDPFILFLSFYFLKINKLKLKLNRWLICIMVME